MKHALSPFRLAPYFSPRPWGSLDLSPWYSQKLSEPIGEAWLTGKDCVIESGEASGQTLGQLVEAHGQELLGIHSPGDQGFPLLLKLLFPKEKLSVQVHPDDAMAEMAAGELRGKTECWYVLDAEPGARIALGFNPSAMEDLRAGAIEEKIRGAVREKTLERMLDWIPVSAGDMIYVDAGTVHSIGPGVVLLETQQYSDLTYRLYDYGRPRELHLDLALRALKRKTDAGKVEVVHYPGYDQLIRQRYFIVERHWLAAGEERRLENAMATAHSLVALHGTATVTVGAENAIELRPGRAVVIPSSWPEYTIAAGEAFSAVRAMPPGNS